MHRKIVPALKSKVRRVVLEQIGLSNFIVKESAYQRGYAFRKNPRKVG